MVKSKRVLKKRRTQNLKVSHNKESEKMERGQVWSVDVLLAVVIFVSVILIFYVTMSSRQKPDIKELQAESSSLKLELEKNHELSFILNDQVDELKFQAFVDNATDNYTALKQKLGVKGDFCIFYEDAEGYIIPINDSNNLLVGVGNGNISIAGIPCGSALPP
jgi:ribosome assembly protein YihI (activator of Der GTPase)